MLDSSADVDEAPGSGIAGCDDGNAKAPAPFDVRLEADLNGDGVGGRGGHGVEPDAGVASSQILGR